MSFGVPITTSALPMVAVPTLKERVFSGRFAVRISFSHSFSVLNLIVYPLILKEMSLPMATS
jgi:hypothetical protein